MNERMKILELLEQGKITAEQANELLAALDSVPTRGGQRAGDKWNFGELKNIGSQVSAAVSQSLTDVKRALENQFENFPFGFNNSTVSVTHEISLPAQVVRLSAETTNGKIQVSAWDEPFVKLHIRGHMRTNSLTDGKRALQNSIQLDESGDRCDLTIVHGKKDKTTGAYVSGAHLDIFVPKSMHSIAMRTQNGSIYTDSLVAEDVQLETLNGGITVLECSSERIQLSSENGGMDIQHSLSAKTKQVYAFTKNGTINVDGISPDLKCVGSARTSFGRIDVSTAEFEVDYDDLAYKNFVRFRQRTSVDADETRIQLETKHGAIRVRS